MSTATLTPPSQPSTKEEQPYVEPTKPRRTGLKLLVVLVVWVVGWLLFRGKNTLALSYFTNTGFQTWLNNRAHGLQDLLAGHSLFGSVVTGLSNVLNGIFSALQNTFSTPSATSTVPLIGWAGVFAILVWLAFAFAGWRSALLVAVGTSLFGFLGFWEHSTDTLIVTAMALVICLVVGIPVGITMARRQRVSNVVTPILDAMQTAPTFSYLFPIFLLFGPGAACAIVLTVIYAMPPLIRITEHGIRNVSPATIEAARSMGLTERQLLRQVQLPMSRRTIVVGINQCTLAALSMTVIAGFVNGPGLGTDVLQALSSLNVGDGAVPGLLIVAIAIMLDRSTTAASERAEVAARGRAGASRGRRIGLVGGGVVAVALVILSTMYLQLAIFPAGLNAGPRVAQWINSVTNAVTGAINQQTLAFTKAVSNDFLNPLQSLTANSPWWLVALVILALAWTLAGARALVPSVIALAVVLGVGLWNDTMVMLTSVLVATLLVMVLAVVLGVWIGRSHRADLVIRPILDAFQTIPAFVYLIPALALFNSTRLTAIVAAVAYATPVAVKLVADGIRGVPSTTVEAARSTGSSTFQLIRKVQLPMARSGLVLATNQGLLYVLSVVVIGGMVGAGSLGYIVNLGFSQDTMWGKGVAASIAIVAVGIMIDRITRRAAEHLQG